MKIASVHIEKFKRFEKLAITGLPQAARLVVLAGPNGNGKSSLFDGFLSWRRGYGGHGWTWDATYHARDRNARFQPERIRLTFHGHDKLTPDEVASAIHIRSAYRNDAVVQLEQITRLGEATKDWRLERLAANDASVTRNLQRIAGQTLDEVYGSAPAETTYAYARAELNGRVNKVFATLLPNLTMDGLGNPIEVGSFHFSKGSSKGYHYNNLSGGEKAIFDLVLDLIVQGKAFGHAVYCIDEPETHVNPNLHALLLKELLELIPAGGQLWIATHSIGMLRQARDLQRIHGASEIVFLDFDRPFDEEVVLTPTVPDRAFWNRALTTAVGDIAELVAPEVIVFCEGSNPTAALGAGTDAAIYQRIFAGQLPEVSFTSLGSSTVVVGEFGKAVSQLFSTIKGTRVIRLVDGDRHSSSERTDLLAQGVRALTRRHLESYLLDDEILSKLCTSVGRQDKVAELLQAKNSALAAAVAQGHAQDNIKKAAGSIRVSADRLIGVGTQTTHGFMVDVLAPLVTPDTVTYRELKRDIFG
jgi:hypothetical protein